MKICVKGTKYLSIILLMIGLTVHVTGEKNCVGDNCEKNCVGDNCEKKCVGDNCESDKCDSESINEIIKNRDVEEEELLKDAFWSVGGKPYPNMQNPTVAYVHYGHCTKVVKEKSYEKSEVEFIPIEKKFDELKKVFEDDTTNKESKAAFIAQREIRDAFKSKLDMETKHFDHCDNLLTKTEESGYTKKVLRKTKGFNEAQKDTYCLKTFSQYSSAKAEWWFGYSYFLYIYFAASKQIKTSSLERIAADNFGEYIMSSGKKRGLVKEYEKELKKKSVKKLNTLAHYCQPKPTKFDYCKLPAETGECEGPIERWFFNTVSQKCETFEYEGCERNKNNFNTERECSTTCDSKDEIKG